jgi:hypothetical protein
MMSLLVSFISIILLGILFYQDVKSREFSAVLLPGLFVLFIFYNLKLLTWAEYWLNIQFNLIFTIAVFVVLVLYISIKNKKLINISKAHLATGDILFYLTCAFLFSFINFVFVFFVITPFLTILGIGLLKLFKVKLREEIPLAGVQAFFLMILFVGTFFFDSLKLNDDQLIFKLLNI